MFKTRLLSGIVLVALALVLIITGGDLLLVSTLVISYIGMFELYRIFHIEKSAPGIIGYLAATVYYCNLRFEFIPDLMMFVLGFFMLLMFAYVFTYPKYKTEQIMAAFFGVFYVAVMLSYVYQTRMLAAGAYIVWLIFLCSWGCDTCAYCVGMLIGKHKMSPKLSPKKSIEGAVGGVIGAALLTILYGMIFKSAMNSTQTHVFIMAGISAVGALISMVGDLTASAIKRNYEIKDYGKLIPGHGGILDRFDSVIFTAPVIYFLAANFIVL
jgi:phosphatidate cytidylyltransferase